MTDFVSKHIIHDVKSKGESRATFAHVVDLLLENIMTVFINMSPQEVLESIGDLQPGSHHGHPLPYSVALQPRKHCQTFYGN